MSAVVADIGQPPAAATSTTTNVPPPTNNAADNTAYNAAVAQGAVLNVSPVLVVATDQKTNEGQLLDLSGTGGASPQGLYIDPDLGDSHSATVNWGDGTPTQNATVIAGVGAGAIGGTHTYADDGTYTVTVDVMDNNGGSDSKTLNVLVKNVPPVLVTATDQMVNEGQALDLSGMGGAPPLGLFVDPGLLDTHTATVSWGDGSAAENATVIEGLGAGVLGGTHTYADDGVYTVNVTVKDDDGGMDMKSFQVTVKNVPPVLVTATDQMVNEGQALDLSGMGGAPPLGLFVDPGLLDTHTATVSWGDGSALENATVTEGLGAGVLGGTHTYADDGIYTVNVTVKDDDGGMDMKSFQVTVKNVAPTVTTPNGNQAILEGGTVSFANLATFTDPGFDNPLNPNAAAPPNITDPLHESFTYDISWGDGRDAVTGASIADVNGGPGTPSSGTIGGSHTYADDGAYTVTITVHDDNGGVNSSQFTVTVNNVTLTVATPNGNQTILEGGTVSFANLATFTDPGFDNPLNPNAAVPPNITDPLHESFTYDLNWGDGRDAITGASISDVNGGPGTPSSGTIGGSHTYADDGTYTVTITVHDDNGGVNSSQFTVSVNNVAPTVAVPNGNPTILEGGTVSLANLATFTDPGFDNPVNPNAAVPPNIADPLHESFTYDIDWGDGRNAVTGASIVDINGAPGTPSSGTIGGSHIYADDGTYTVMVTVHDDNGGANVAQFTVTVNNVAPSITGPVNNLHVNEGQPFVLSDLGAATFNLGLGITDPGFDNPLNPNAATPGNLDPTHETFTGVSINWGDGTASDALAIVNRTTDPVDGPTTALLQHTPHVYADNGDYKVTITAFDDNGGALTPQIITIHVNNVAPTLSPTSDSFIVNEGSVMNIPNLGTFSDPGFTDANNTPPSAETFTYSINWGDGTTQTGLLPATVTPGAHPNSATPELIVPTLGALANSHLYADNPTGGNTYTITVRLADDDMSANFTGGTNGVDYVEKQITVTVLNVNPTLQPITATDVTPTGHTTLNLTFSDPGADTFQVLVDWGDKLNLPPDQRFVVATVHAGPTPASFTLDHLYAGPPDPIHPTADIIITVKIFDDDQAFAASVVQPGISNLASATITNPGIHAANVAIDTTPQVPRLVLSPPQVTPRLLDQQSSAPQSLQPSQPQIVHNEMSATSERYLELVVVSPDGKEIERYRLSDEAIVDLRGLFRTLPDNRYKIYLFRTDNNSRRLVMDVFVRRGRVIDPSDASEGTRDRPPTAEGTQQNGNPQQQVQPLKDNPLLQPVPAESGPGAANEPSQPANDVAPPAGKMLGNDEPIRSRSSFRWAIPLVGLGLVANQESWSRRVAAALEEADESAWQRLRRAGRLGRTQPTRRQKVSAASDDLT